MSDPSPDERWVPAISIGGEATIAQRQRNFALYKRLRDGFVDERAGNLARSGLSGFVYDVPIERLSIGPLGNSFSFRLKPEDECFQRLLHVIADHFDSKCDADDEVERLHAGIRALHDMVDHTNPNDPIGVALTKAGLERRP